MPATLDPNLQLYFPMNTAPNAQNTIANSAASNSQILSAPVPATGVTLVNDSTFGQCLQFDGNSNSYMTLPSMNIDFSKGLTIEAWVCYSNFIGLSKIIDLGMNQGGNTTGNSNRIALGIAANPVLSFGIQTSSWAFANADQPADNLQTGRWYHVAGTVDQNGNGSVYINGILKNTNNPMPVPVNIARDHCFIGKTNDGSQVFQGKMAYLRLYNRALSSSEILNDMQGDLLAYVTSNAAPAAHFTSSHPVAFNVYDQQGHAVLYIVADDTEDASTVLTVDLLNVSNNSISLAASTSASAASDTNYHFRLNFPMGVLSANSLNKYKTAQTLASNWSVFSKSNTANRQDSLYLLYTAGVTLAPAARLTLDLNLSAAASAGARGSQVEMLPNPAQVTFTDKTPVLGGQIAAVQIISHQGVRNIPLQVGFVGTNQILNDGATANSLILEIINTLNARDLGSGVIALDPANTKFVIQFDSSPDNINPGDPTYVPWALGTLSQVKTITIVPDVSTPNWTINQTIDGQQPQWEITPSGITKLNPGDTIKLNLSNIVSSIRSGLTNMILNYEGIPGYWDGQFVCPISKSPLFFYDPPFVQPAFDLLLDLDISNVSTNLAPKSNVTLKTDSSLMYASDDTFGNCVDLGIGGNAATINIFDDSVYSLSNAVAKQFTFAAWIKFDPPLPTYGAAIFSVGNVSPNTPYNTILLLFDPAGKKLRLFINTSSASSNQLTSYDVDFYKQSGIWTHMAFSMNAGQQPVIYLNGIHVPASLTNYSSSTDLPLNTTSTPVESQPYSQGTTFNNIKNAAGFIGGCMLVCSGSAINYSNCRARIASLQVYNRVLSQDEIVSVMDTELMSTTDIGSGISIDAVGIGTLTPQAKLDVNGTMMVRKPAIFSDKVALTNSLIVNGPATFNNDFGIGLNQQLRIEGGSGITAFSMGGNGDFQIDAPSIPGGRFVVTDSGNVGIGTNEPTATLHVDGESFITGKLGVGTHSPSAPLHVNGDSYFVGNVGVGINPPSAPLHVKGDSYLMGNVGVGTTLPVAPLHVATQSSSVSISGYYRDSADHQGPLSPGGTWQVSIYAMDSIVSQSRIIAGSINTNSDVRAKLIFGVSNGAQDLALLQKLSVTNYQWIDPLINGDAPQKKLVAQDVEKIYPQAVNLLPLPTVIPNVYQSAVAFWHDSDTCQLTVTTSKPHEFEPGDRIDLYTNQEDMKNISVQVVLSDRQFVVDCDKAPEKVFVYGKYVTDFRTIDYDAIAMLNVSATQELARRVEMLEARLAAFEKGLVA